MGPNFRALFDQEKPALLEQIDAEIEKVKGIKPPAPIRGKNSASAQSNSGGNGGDNEDDGEEADDPIKQQLQAESMMPRTDISSQLTDQLMDQLINFELNAYNSPGVRCARYVNREGLCVPRDALQSRVRLPVRPHSRVHLPKVM